MRMWLSCVVLLCAAYIVEPSPEEWKIVSITQKSLTWIPDRSETKKIATVLLTCYTVDSSVYANVVSSTLAIGRFAAGIHEKIFYEHDNDDLTNLPEVGCKYFNGEIPLSYLGKEANFLLDHHSTKSSLAFSEASFTLPSAIIEKADVMSSHIVGLRETLGTHNGKATLEDSLRLVGGKVLDGWNVCIDKVYKANGLVCDSTNKLCYAIEVGVDVSKPYSLCIKEKDGDAIFTTDTLTIPTDTVKWDDNDPTSVLLSNEYTTTEDIPTDVLANMIISSASAGANLEFVPYTSATDAYAVCKKTDITCDLATYFKSDAKMQILIVDPTGKKSNVLTFKDYVIDGEHLGETIIETYWKRGENPADFKTFYEASIATVADQGTELKKAIIDCSSDNPNANTICYAYFTGLAEPSYFVTLTPADDTEEPADNNDLTKLLLNNQIKTGLIPEPEIGRQQARILDISLIPDTRYAYDVITVCYEASEGNHNRTRDEVILIDEGGHWMKIHHSTEGENHMHCFSPVDLLKSSLRITTDTKLTAVIVERELNGNKVLASGQKDIDLSALRAIKPEVDNGNNGSTSTLAIVGAVIAGIACLMALVAAAVMFVMKMNRDNDGTQYPLHRSNIEDSNVVHGLDNPIPTM